MGYSRKDQVYVLSNFFVLVLIGFTCFMSSDFIRLLTFDTVGDESYWIFLYHLVFWMATMKAMLVKTPAAPCLMYCIRLNIVFMAGACVSYLMKWYVSVSLHFLIVFWAYLAASAMVNAVAFASYHTSGSRGLALGCMLSFCTTYIVLEVLKYIIWTHNEVGHYRNLVVGYIVFRIILSFVTMALLSVSAGTLHFAEFDRAFAYLKKGVLLDWISGTLHETDVQVALSEVVPRYVSPMVGINEIRKSSQLTILWLMFIFLTLSCSIFTPYIGVSNWDLSIFKIGELDRAEHVGNFAGTVIGALWGKSWCNLVMLSLVYLVHVILSIFLSCYVHDYRISLAIPMEPIIALTCITAAMGSYLTVVTFAQFFDICLDMSCINHDEKKKKNDEDICCLDDDSNECLCSEQFSHESCGKNPCDSQNIEPNNMKIYVPPHNREMYKLWLPEYCILCWLYRHNPSEVCCTAENHESTSTSCDNAKKYILRNCKVSICPYCDMNLLMECESLQCTCIDECRIPLPNANEVEDEEEAEQASACEAEASSSSEEEETDDKPIKLPLHEMLLPGDNISIVTTASSSYVIPDSACCTTGSASCKQENAEQGQTPNGRTFSVTSVSTYACCHYSLKVMISCRDPMTKFHLMEQPYAGKYNPVGSIVFNGTNKTEAANKGAQASQPSNCNNAQKNENKCKIKESKESIKHAAQNSKLTSLTKLAWLEDPTGENGLCVCCKHAKEMTDKANTASSHSSSSPSSSSTSPTCPNQPSSPSASGTPGTSTCPQCCHIKVQPTALPYHFRGKDIYRRNFVGALFFGLIFYGFAKLLSAGVFAVMEIRYGLDLSSNFSLVDPFYKQSDDSSLYGIKPDISNEDLLAMFEKERQDALQQKAAELEALKSLSASSTELMSSLDRVKLLTGDVGEAADNNEGVQNTEETSQVVIEDVNGTNSKKSSSPSSGEGSKDSEKKLADNDDDDEEDEEKEETLLDYEKDQMEEVMMQYKWLFNDLEYAYLENWAEVYIDMKKEEEDIEKMKKIRRVKWCLEAGLKDYSLQSTQVITKYLEYMEGKWQAEWKHYESRIRKKFKVIGNNLSRLSPMNSSNISDKDWKPSVTQAKIALWKNANDMIGVLGEITKKLDELNNNYMQAKGADEIVQLLKLWQYRVDIIDGLTKEGELFLGWSIFLERWTQLKHWSELFLPMYLSEYKNLGEQ